MTISKLLLVAASAALLFMNLAVADDDSLYIGSVQMRLGMAREPLLARLRSQYRLTELDKDFYLIDEKRGNEYHPLGTVKFALGKVSRLSRHWGQFNGKDALDLAHELHSALQNLQEASGRPVVVSPLKTRSSPGQQPAGIEFSSGAHSLTLLIIEGSGAGVSLQEDLSTK